MFRCWGSVTDTRCLPILSLTCASAVNKQHMTRWRRILASYCMGDSSDGVFVSVGEWVHLRKESSEESTLWGRNRSTSCQTHKKRTPIICSHFISLELVLLCNDWIVIISSLESTSQLTRYSTSRYRIYTQPNTEFPSQRSTAVDLLKVANSPLLLVSNSETDLSNSDNSLEQPPKSIKTADFIAPRLGRGNSLQRRDEGILLLCDRIHILALL